MDRREFLISTGGVAVAATAPALAPAPAQAAPERTVEGAPRPLQLALAWGDRPQGPAENARRLARRFETMTGGRHRIEITGSADARNGDADLFYASPHDLAHLHPAFAYFGGLPGAAQLSAGDFAHWITVGGGQMLWDDLAADYGLKPLLAGHSGDAPPLWSREPIGRLADLAGQPVAVPGLGADVARALGAEPRVLAPDEMARALAEGTVRAAEAGGLLASLASGIPQVARHATGQGLNGHGIFIALNIRLDVWEQLPEGDQAILTAAAAEELQVSLAEARAHERIARETLEAAFGVRFAPWPAEVAEALDRVAEATIAHVAGFDERAARIDQSYMAFRAAISGSAVPRRARPVV